MIKELLLDIYTSARKPLKHLLLVVAFIALSIEELDLIDWLGLDHRYYKFVYAFLPIMGFFMILSAVVEYGLKWKTSADLIGEMSIAVICIAVGVSLIWFFD